ncbi:DUF501 domain-containing protein [Corynebacterium heidelbergense]|uniref:DUF501 domain-containing protein n=1 Tax=Corynebacterium heidelbergense TaxID=2055947 RepID=A0A364V428_9CORY|nr:DUF501 domain-containing protein [Corynebacterium heidelbergense]
MPVTDTDMAIMEKQLGRAPRGAVEVSYYTPDGQPAVVMTHPKLPDGTPFPTLYYLTDPRLTAEASRLEVGGVMKTMERRLGTDPQLAADYRAAHEHYLRTRNALADLGTKFSGGGMPDRVKCLHVLMAYVLAEGPQRVRLGTEAVALAAEHQPGLRGTAIPADWPTTAELGITLAQAMTEEGAKNVGFDVDQARQRVQEAGPEQQAPRFAAIDCGTNSIRLLIAEVGDDGNLVELNRDNIIVRLGQGVDATGRFHEEALQRVDSALDVYAQRMLSYGVTDVMMGATSATRDAENREEFFEITRRHLSQVAPGARAEVITGEREAELSFAGATIDLAAPDEGERVCVIDLGGGSTEFVVGTVRGPGRGEATVDAAYSADMGCVRLTERYLHTQPPQPAEISEAEAYVTRLLREVEAKVDLASADRVVGVAGTMTTMTAIATGMRTYDPGRIHMASVSLERFREVARDLLHRTVEQRSELGPMHPGRADVIGGGAIVVDAFTSRFLDLGLEQITVSEKDILDGMLAEVIARNL